MNDPLLFDLADVQALLARFNRTDLAWATLPAPWRFRTFSDRGFDQAPAYVQHALEVLIEGGGGPGATIDGISGRVAGRYDGVVAARADRQRVGPRFSALEVAWLREATTYRLTEPGGPGTLLRAMQQDVIGNPLRLRRQIRQGFDDGGAGDVEDARALVERYLGAERAVLQAMVEREAGEDQNERQRVRL
ncbi:hypothetical protein [Burkholderia anthina]|uniref:hypothetical protein n=1 Tax=Burkholderia anthina TaxID=179879 RepID=UPI0037BE3EF7